MPKEESIDTKVIFNTPLEPGWYEVDMSLEVKRGDYKSTLSGNASRFFVRYPGVSIVTDDRQKLPGLGQSQKEHAGGDSKTHFYIHERI